MQPEPGERVVEVIPCADVPYTCDGFDPADYDDGRIPDFTLVREWERRLAARSETAATG